MKFGIHNPSWLFGPNPYEMFEAVKQKAQWSEQHGFAWFSVMDHLIQITGVGAPDEPFMEGWTVLSALAAVTSKIRLATLVSSVAYRNPAHLAKMPAGVDIISRGRLTFGIGAGWYVDEYKQYNWVFPEKPAVRIGQMEEAIGLTEVTSGHQDDVERAARDISRQVFPGRQCGPRTQAGPETSSADYDQRSPQ